MEIKHNSPHQEFTVRGINVFCQLHGHGLP